MVLDIIEIGMPFSDPMADGPTIQESSNRVYKNGIKINDDISLKLLEKLENLIIMKFQLFLMGYYNSIFNLELKILLKNVLLKLELMD